MSEAMKLLQAKCGVAADGSFGPNTAKAIAAHFKLTPERGAHLLGQASHESGGFKLTRENLNYSADVMCKVWPSRFKSVEEAAPFARNPKALAENVYFGRMGNTSKQMASLYIGRGFLQLTGYDNHKAFAHDMNLPEVLTDPSLLERELAFETALWFFEKNGLMSIADEGVNVDTILRITKRVNGGTHGLDDRTQQTNKIFGWLKKA
jgi:putative chitinase